MLPVSELFPHFAAFSTVAQPEMRPERPTGSSVSTSGVGRRPRAREGAGQ